MRKHIVWSFFDCKTREKPDISLFKEKCYRLSGYIENIKFKL